MSLQESLKEMPSTEPELSVVIPVFNEDENVELLLNRLVPVLERITKSFEILFVDDGYRIRAWRSCAGCMRRMDGSKSSR